MANNSTQPLPSPPDAPSDSPAAQLVLDLENRLHDMQDQLDSVYQELSVLRARDEMLKSHMSRINEEMRLAARLQRDFLPKTLPQLGPIRFHAIFRPASYVSGDLYDVMRLDEHHLGFYMADAIGHGVPAALLTMYVKRALVTKEILHNGYRLLTPAETIGRINDAIMEQDLSQVSFATVLYGTINVQTLEMRFARGGHPQPLLIRPNEPLRFLECEGPLLGILPSSSYSDCTTILQPGDRILLYTDGVEVAFGGGDGKNLDRWLDEVDRRKHLPSQDLLHEFCQEIDNESGSLQPDDDLTALILEVLPTSDQGVPLS